MTPPQSGIGTRTISLKEEVPGGRGNSRLRGPSLSHSFKNATPTGETRRGSRRARKVDRRLGSACVGSAAAGSKLWLVMVSGGTATAESVFDVSEGLERGRGRGVLVSERSRDSARTAYSYLPKTSKLCKFFCLCLFAFSIESKVHFYSKGSYLLIRFMFDS